MHRKGEVMKTENDYIAEYVKEKRPELLGIGFWIWKMGRILKETLDGVAESMKGLHWPDAEEYLEEVEEHLLKEQEEKGE